MKRMIRWLLVFALILNGCTDTGVGTSAPLPFSPDTTAPLPPNPDEKDIEESIVGPEEDELALFNVEPSFGPTTGLTQVEIIGSGFGGGLLVSFNDSLAIDTFSLLENC